MESKDFSKGSIPVLITKLAIPMIAAMLVNALYSIVDRIYIGHLPGVGATALTGVGLCYPITMSVAAFACLVGNGGGPITSILLGKKETDEAEKVIGNSLSLLVILGISIPTLCLIFRKPILYLFGASDITYPYADSYITIYLIGSIAVMLTLGLNPFLNAQGFAKMGMLTVCIGAVVNIVLDPVFIFGLNMGVRGAAIATIIAQTASAIWVLTFLLSKKRNLRIKIKNLKIELGIAKKILSLGMATFIMNITEAALSAAFNSSLKHFGGDLYVTVMTVTTSIANVLFMPLSGLTQGAQPVTGYNFGAKEYDRVKACFKFLLMSCGIYSVIMWLVVIIFPESLIRIFNTDPGLIEAAVPMMRIYFCVNFIMALQMASQNTFVAMGEAKKATFFAIFRKLILLIPLIFILPRIGLGLKGVFAAEPVADTISALTCFTTFMLTSYRRLNKDDK